MSMPNESGLPEPQAALARNAAGTVTAGASPSGGVFAQGLSGAGVPPVVAAGANAGTGASVGSQKGHDLGGSFVLTVGTTPAAGALATVAFGAFLAAAPAAILLSCWDQTSAAGVAVGPTSITATGFTVSGPASTAAHTLLVNYLVLYA